MAGSIIERGDENIVTLKEMIFGGCGAIVILMTLIQITPIKVNPWSAIARSVGRAINKDVIEKFNHLGNDIQSVKEEIARVDGKVGEQAAVNCRSRILRFGDEVRRGVLHSKEHFDQTLRDIDTYNRYCEEHPLFMNSVTEQTSIKIKEVYHECLDKNNFL